MPPTPTAPFLLTLWSKVPPTQRAVTSKPGEFLCIPYSPSPSGNSTPNVNLVSKKSIFLQSLSKTFLNPLLAGRMASSHEHKSLA